MADLFDLIKQRYWSNADRVGNLILLAVDVAKGTGNTALQGGSADVLRSAVVFLHATLEDAIRTLARQRLGTADDAALESVQQALGSKNKPYKFTLTELARHRGKTIDEFLNETIEVYLSARSFSSTSEVSAFLPMIRLNTSDFTDLFPYLDELMRRRHEIVHTADLNRHDDSEPRAWVADDAAALQVWASAVSVFVARLLSKLDAPERVNSLEHQAFIAQTERDLQANVEMRRDLAAATSKNLRH